MGLFDSSSSSSAVTNLSTAETTRQVNQQVSNGISYGVESSGNVNITDAGAITQNAAIAKAAVEGGNNLAKQVSSALAGANDNNASLAGKVSNTIADVLKQSLDFARGFASDANGLVKQSTAGALSTVERATQSAISAAQPSVDVKQIAIAVVVVFGAVLLFMSRK